MYRALCHCRDCRRHSGAPMVAWGLVPKEQLKVDGEVQEYVSSENGRRQFCPTCGTGLFYINEASLPGLVDIQAGTFDDPEAAAPGVHIQTAERLDYMTKLGDMPTFERYPG